MNIPNLPNISTPLIDKDGKMNNYWYLFFSQLNQGLQISFSQEGINIPMQTSENISKIQAGKPTSSIIANKDTGDVYVSINGIFKKITVT